MYASLIILALILQLGSSNFREREQAQVSLIKARPYCLYWLNNPPKVVETDPEIRLRIKRIKNHIAGR